MKYIVFQIPAASVVLAHFSCGFWLQSASDEIAFAIKCSVPPTAVDPVYLAHFSGVSGFGVRSMKLRLRLSVLCFQFPEARFTWPTALF